MKKIIVFCVAFLATMSLWASETSVKNAYDVEIWYDFDNESNTASVTYKGSSSLDYYDEYTGEVVIPSTVMYGGEEYSVTSIGSYAFAYCGSLTSITLPESVISIGEFAFDECTSLTSITIPEGVTSIGSGAFSHCAFTSIMLPEGVTEIGDNAFEACSSLTSIDVASNNNNYTSIDGVLFSKDKTILIKYPEGKKDVTSYTIPEGVTKIGNSAFVYCSFLTSITLPEGVTEIGDYAFEICSSLTSITLPEGVTEIGDRAFDYCISLTSITCKNTTPPILIESLYYEGENFTFDDVDKSIPLYVPAESVEVYKKTKYWKDFTNIQAIPSSSVANAKAETQDSVRKEYRDGQVLIIKGDKTYTMFGTEY